MMTLAIVIPTLNEEAAIANALGALTKLRAAGCEVVVADGGSVDRTIEYARPLCDQVVTAPRGRGSQMNAGAAAYCCSYTPTRVCRRVPISWSATGLRTASASGDASTRVLQGAIPSWGSSRR
jgi:glycosyltransferase involved in cell wall biosynthesis